MIVIATAATNQYHQFLLNSHPLRDLPERTTFVIIATTTTTRISPFLLLYIQGHTKDSHPHSSTNLPYAVQHSDTRSNQWFHDFISHSSLFIACFPLPLPLMLSSWEHESDSQSNIKLYLVVFSFISFIGVLIYVLSCPSLHLVSVLNSESYLHYLHECWICCHSPDTQSSRRFCGTRFYTQM